MVAECQIRAATSLIVWRPCYVLSNGGHRRLMLMVLILLGGNLSYGFQTIFVRIFMVLDFRSWLASRSVNAIVFVVLVSVGHQVIILRFLTVENLMIAVFLPGLYHSQVLALSI